VDLTEIRKTIITAVASDDLLREMLVLKGGNALELVHKIGERASLDVDFSLEGDFESPEEVRARLFKALRDRFDAAGYVLFDEEFGPRPSDRVIGSRWGGYNAAFKLAGKELLREAGGDLDRMRRQAVESGPHHERRFRIEISAFEYCGGKQKADVEDHTCWVYSLEMIVVEKLRAICQQSADYPLRRNPAPRARDFYDIFAAVSQGGVDFSKPELHALVRIIFGAKQVELSLIGEIHESREFHRRDWPAVVNAVRVPLRQFDYYFEFVLAEAVALEPLWVM
jgi:hypothetical protein